MDDDDDSLLTPGEVARLFRVDVKTVRGWDASGKLKAVKTPGGHRRFRRSSVDKFLAEEKEG
jgi:excisionase family DNA binding protein